jgi:hypothetical protein
VSQSPDAPRIELWRQLRYRWRLTRFDAIVAPAWHKDSFFARFGRTASNQYCRKSERHSSTSVEAG